MGAALATIVVPCWQAGPHLRPMLESLLAQSRQDFVLVLVDDASSDGSAEVARATCGDRITVHVNEQRLGLARNWNRCAALVDTPFFCLAHMDDVYERDFVARTLAVLESDPGVGAVHTRAGAIDSDGRAIDSPSERAKLRSWRGLATTEATPAGMYAALYAGNFVCCPSLVYRTAAFRATGGFDETLGFALDWKLLFELLLAGSRIVGVPETLVRYRRHAANATLAMSRSLARYREEALVLDWARERGTASGLLAPRARTSRALRNNLLYDAWCDLVAGRDDAVRAKLAFARIETPHLCQDAWTRAFGVASRLGAPGRALLTLALHLVVRRAGR